MSNRGISSNRELHVPSLFLRLSQSTESCRTTIAPVSESVWRATYAADMAVSRSKALSETWPLKLRSTFIVTDWPVIIGTNNMCFCLKQQAECGQGPEMKHCISAPTVEHSASPPCHKNKHMHPEVKHWEVCHHVTIKILDLEWIGAPIGGRYCTIDTKRVAARYS
eukprot:3358641-Amphidinium_carterae.1